MQLIQLHGQENRQPPGIILVRTNSSTVRIVSDPVKYSRRYSSWRSFLYLWNYFNSKYKWMFLLQVIPELNVINGTATLALDPVQLLQQKLMQWRGIRSKYLLMFHRSLEFTTWWRWIDSGHITNVTIVSGIYHPVYFRFYTRCYRGKFRIYGTPDTEATELVVLRAVRRACSSLTLEF